MSEALSSGFLHRSVSQLGTFTQCGEQYRLEKVAKAPRSPAAWFHQGTAFHESIELFESSGRMADVNDCLSHFDEIWAREHAKALEREPDINNWLTGGRTRPQVDIDNRFARGRMQVEDYISWADSQPWRMVEIAEDEYACEVPFEIILGGVAVKGSIDQVVQYPDGGYRVRDLKTGTKLPSWPFQLAVYNLAIEEVLGITPGWGDYYMSKNTACTDPYPLQRYTREIVGGWFASMHAAERASVYLPNPGDSCRTCGVSQWCLAIGTSPDTYSPFGENLV